jgi:hypothetical protein
MSTLMARISLRLHDVLLYEGRLGLFHNCNIVAAVLSTRCFIPGLVVEIA